MFTLGDATVNSKTFSPLHGRNNLMFKKIGQTNTISGPFSESKIIHVKQYESIIAITLGISIEVSQEIFPFSVNLITKIADNLSITLNNGSINVDALNSVILVENTDDVIIGTGSMKIPQSGTLSMSSTLYLLDEPINEFYVQILPTSRVPVNATIYLDVFKEGLFV